MLLPAELADGVRRHRRALHRRQPGHAELPAARARQVRPPGFDPAPDEWGYDGRRLLPRHGVRHRRRNVARALRHGEPQLRLPDRRSHGRTGTFGFCFFYNCFYLVEICFLFPHFYSMGGICKRQFGHVCTLQLVIEWIFPVNSS